MRNKGQLILGLVIVLVGVILLTGNLFHVNVWAFFWPLVFIGLGIWMLVRPRTVKTGTKVQQRLLGDIRRRGVWQVTDEEFWILVGDVKLDMTTAEIPQGETLIRTYGFVGSVTLIVPEGIGVSVSSTAFVTDAKILGHKQENILSPLHEVSDDYEVAERKIRLECSAFVADLKVRRAKSTTGRV